MKKIKLYTMLFLTAFTAFAQNSIKENNTFSLPGTIETMKIASGGIVLVGTSEGLTAIEAHSNNVAYQYNTLGKIKPEEMTMMDNLPYVILTRGYTKVILNYISGEEIFNSLKSGWSSVSSIKSDFTNQKIYMLGSNAQGYAFGVFNANTLANEGIINFSDKKTMGVYIDVTRYYESNGKLFVRTEKGIVCVDKKSFKIDWAYDDLDKVWQFISVITNPEKGLFFVTESDGKNSLLHKIDNSGKRTTKKPVKLEATTQTLSFVPQGLLCQMYDGKTSFQLYNVQTAEKIWEKPVEIKGSLFLAEKTQNEIIYASNSGLINTIDLNNGSIKLKKDIKTGDFFSQMIFLENDNVFYITSIDMGIANLKTGEYVKEPIKFKKATNMISSFDEKNNRFVVSTGTELYFITKDGTSTKVTDIKFKEDETPSKIEFRDSGILLGAKQNNLMISYEGKIIYESYYKAPGQSLAAKIALGALAATLASQSLNQNMAGNNKDANQSASAAGGMAGEFSKRFGATKDTKNFLYILTKLDDGIGLVKLNKDNGTKIAELLLKDKKPTYEVDDDFGILYFKSDKKQIKSYDLR